MKVFTFSANTLATIQEEGCNNAMWSEFKLAHPFLTFISNPHKRVQSEDSNYYYKGFRKKPNYKRLEISP